MIERLGRIAIHIKLNRRHIRGSPYKLLVHPQYTARISSAARVAARATIVPAVPVWTDVSFKHELDAFVTLVTKDV